MDIFILMALADGPVHGYAAMQAVRERSDGAVRVSTGSFYRRLVAADARTGSSRRRPGRAVDDPRRGAYYRVTRARPAGPGATSAIGSRRSSPPLDGLRPSPRRGRA